MALYERIPAISINDRQDRWRWPFSARRFTATDFSKLKLTEVHLFHRLGKRILFHVDSMQFFEASPLVFSLVQMMKTDAGGADPHLHRYYDNQETRAAIDDLLKNKVLLNRDIKPPPAPELKKRLGIRHLELMVTHACNMRCTYCYGKDEQKGWRQTSHLYGSETSGMSWDTARQGIDFLLQASGPARDVNVVFFGGEPLLEFRLIRRIVHYAREQSQGHDKRVHFSLSTNGLGLTDAVVDFLVEHDIACQVSIDGPAFIQDANRRLASGKASYDHVIKGVKRLLAKRPGRVPARVTVGRDQANLPEVADHLLNLGFGSVHVEPVIGGCSGLEIDSADLETLKRQTEMLARYMVRRVRNGKIFNYANLVRQVRQTRQVDQRLAHYCGAARTYLALAQDGAFYPCHRFVGMPEYRMGDLLRGFDNRLQKRILNLSVDQRPACRDCWARYLCGGGCWKHAEDAHGCLEQPDENTSCALIRHQIECAMAVNTQLKVSDQTLLTATADTAEL